MKRVVLALVLAAGSAAAAPLVPPAGWTLDPALAPAPAATRFGGKITKVDVYAYRAPVPGAVLYANRAEAEVPAADRDRLATLELEEPRDALRRQGATAKAEQDAQRFDPATKQLEAAVTWRDPAAGIVDASRVVIAGDATRLVAVTGQCVLAADAPAEVATACEAALATLDPEVPAAARVPLAIVRTEAEPPPKPAPDILDDGRSVSLPPIRVDQPAAPQPDRRPIYLGAGLVVLAAVFWWNRKRREKFEREHPREEPRDVPRAAARQRDEDADDLHAAAEAGDDGESR